MRRAGYSTAKVLGWFMSLGLVFFLAVHVLITYERSHHPHDIRHRAQFNSINAAIELFANEYDGYPSSDANAAVGQPYCGSMKLTEALMGQDLLGFHVSSGFRADGLDRDTLVPFYPVAPSPENLKARRGPYLPAESANAFRLVDIYGKGNTGPFRHDLFVLCDVFERKRPGGSRTGMPILYYRADPNGTAHDVNHPDEPNNIYEYRDNHALVLLGVPGEPNAVHPLADPWRFYLNTQDPTPRLQSQPYRRDSYILISAGWDGLYGTADDICNFAWKYRER